MSDSNTPIIIENIMLTSLDGAIASGPGETSDKRRACGFTNNEDFQHMRKIVASCDAVVIGWRSMACEQGAFRVADLRPDGKEPLWMVFSRSGDVDLSHPFWTQKNLPRAVSFCTDWNPADAPMARSEARDLLGLSTDFFVGNISGILNILKSRGAKRIALLGGGRLNALFWDAGLVSNLHLTLSPFLSGTAGNVRVVESLKERIKLKLAHSRKKGDFLFLEYTVNQRKQQS
jgi:riboflavin biosynthesis pyrimidine reductase